MSDLSQHFAAKTETRLLRYAAVDTQSDARSTSQPSTAIQLDLAAMLQAELIKIGAQDVRITDYGVVLARVPATASGPVIGFVAHMDTAPAFHASGVKPVVHRAYAGGVISFADNPDLKLSPETSPYLAQKIGGDIITASGTTLLGADDKAGVAIIMTLIEHLITSASAHPEIRVAFTPDEEIGRGVDPRLPADLGVDFAYTLDGGALGEIEYESFSADGAVVRIEGVSTHPGTANGKLVNALHLAAKLISILPQGTRVPEVTQHREGFWHVVEMQGTAAEAEVSIILRDFELAGLQEIGDMLRATCAALAAGEPRAKITCDITPQYRNMRYWLEQDMTPVDLARAACEAEGITPLSKAIRGGTDGSRLTEMGVPCPNVFTGMQDIHGPLEWVCVQDIAAAVRVCARLVGAAVR
ncbi:Peptidase T [Aquimixticola soesokkakensis]|uniref:Peptidase T n=1 Tax=Aquimixticola soesokkakensis TaxID=1519096 RepID=A0A1Y5RW33_9RHOB|nr:peptidase T [Aquimixticola soesokkakensis]SLN23904.1 Peptidase T [Aquimixticola soesokkakensis]